MQPSARLRICSDGTSIVVIKDDKLPIVVPLVTILLFDDDGVMRFHAWRDLPVSPVLVSHFNSRLYPLVRSVRWITARLKRSAGGEGTDLSLPPAMANSALRRIFFGEAARLRGALSLQRPAYRQGVSLMALLRRTNGG